MSVKDYSVRIKLLLLLTAVFLVSAAPATAQSKERQAITMAAPDQAALTFYALDTGGDVTQLGSLPAEFRIANVQSLIGPEHDWYIWQPDDLALSPDQQYVAFSAQRDNEHQLFIYRLSGEEVWSAATDGELEIRWSPDSQGFSLASDQSMAYFQLASQRLTELRPLADREYARYFRCLDNQTFTYTFVSQAGVTLETLSLDDAQTRLVGRSSG